MQSDRLLGAHHQCGRRDFCNYGRCSRYCEASICDLLVRVNDTGIVNRW